MSIYITGILLGSIMYLIGKVMHDAEMRRRGVPQYSEPVDRTTVNRWWIVVIVMVALLIAWIAWWVYFPWIGT